MLEKVKAYFDDEYADLCRCLDYKRNENRFAWDTERGFANRTIQNCLAVAQFAQYIGLTYEEVNPLYEELKEKCENLLTD